MAENEKNLVTFKIHQEDLEWAGEEQRRIRKAEQRKVSQAALFARLRATYEKAEGLPSKGGLSDLCAITPNEVEWLTLIRAADRAALDKTWRGLVDSAKQILVQAAKVARTRAKE